MYVRERKVEREREREIERGWMDEREVKRCRERMYVCEREK